MSLVLYPASLTVSASVPLDLTLHPDRPLVVFDDECVHGVVLGVDQFVVVHVPVAHNLDNTCIT